MKEHLFDKRVVTRALQEGLLKQDDYQRMLDALPDLSDKLQTTSDIEVSHGTHSAHGTHDDLDLDDLDDSDDDDADDVEDAHAGDEGDEGDDGEDAEDADDAPPPSAFSTDV